MLRHLLILISLIIYMPAYSQGPVGSWADHLPYNSFNYITSGKGEIYGSTDFAITIYNSQYNEIRKLSKVNGLAGSGISTIGYSDDQDALIIAYTSGNIDIYRNGSVSNIPDIMNEFLPAGISINRIRTYNGFAYLSTGEGIIVIDIAKEEVKDTWKPSIDGSKNEIFDLNISDNTIFAATGSGIFTASDNNQGLTYWGNWDIITNTAGSIYNCIASLDESVFVNKKNTPGGADSVFIFREGSFTYLPEISQTSNHTFEEGPDNIIISGGAQIMIIDSAGNIISSIDEYGNSPINARNSIIVGEDVFIADSSQGFVCLVDGYKYVNYNPEGPYSNYCYNITAADGEVWVAAGGTDESYDNIDLPFMIYGFSGRRWTSAVNDDYRDAVRIIPIPDRPGHVYVSSWGYGVFEYEYGELLNHWDENTLGSIIPGQPLVRIFGMALDKNNRLWITQSGVQENIKFLGSNNTWISLPVNIDAPVIGDILITRSDHKWIVLPGGYGLFILDDNGTPEYFDDDRYRNFIARDQSGEVFSDIYCITEDLDGNIWIGTDRGPAVIYYPSEIFDRDITANRIKIPRDDGSGLADYLLGTEAILDIAVDGGNRKWFATRNTGAYLISESNIEPVRSLNESNSPLMSDRVNSIAVDGLSGEVWFGTEKGIVTIRETGTDGSDNMSRVYAFPNPVREDFTGEVTITGLSRNSNIKITDVSGNLVYETRSTGGDVSWDMKTYNGEKVSTGVYIVFCANEDGNIRTTTKILIIR